MITVRLIKRTHYQVLEPAYLIPLIRKCTSPTRSTYRNVAAQRFLETTAEFNIAASAYAVDLARSLKLLNSNLVWTELGQLLNLVASNPYRQNSEHLSFCEKAFFLRLFLEFDGAALVYFSKKLETQLHLPGTGQTWASLAQELFLDTYEQYLQLITDPQTRTHIRQLAEKRRHAPFRGHSGRHQSLIHINTLFRLGLVEASSTGHNRVYSAKRVADGGRFATSRLLSIAPDVASLEQIIGSQPLYQVVGAACSRCVSSGRVSARVVGAL